MSWPAAATAAGADRPAFPTTGVSSASRRATGHRARPAAGLRVQRRRLLAQRAPLPGLAGRIRRLLGERGVADDRFWWPADEIVRATCRRARPRARRWRSTSVTGDRAAGWAMRAFGAPPRRRGTPGRRVSLACQTMNRRRIGLSFGEGSSRRAPRRQRSARSARPGTSPTPGGRCASSSRRRRRTTTGELLVAAEPDVDLETRVYRLIGDPLAPLLDAPGARSSARALSDDVIFNPPITRRFPS